MTARRRIEAGFTAWGRLVLRWRWAVLVSVLALTAGLGSFVPLVRVDNTEEAFLGRDDPERVRFDRFRDLFGTDDRMLLLIRPPEIFDLDFLERLRSLHLEIEERVPYVVEVTSLLNARNTRGEGDELVVEDLLEHWPEDEADLQRLRDRVLANPLYEGFLVDADLEHTVISIEPFLYSTLVPEQDVLAGFDDPTGSTDPATPHLSDAETREMVDGLFEVIRRHERPDFRIFAAGGPITDHSLMTVLQRDVLVFMPLTLVVIVTLLALLFRRPSGVLLPLAVVLPALVSSMGLMVLLDIPFSITLNILPAFLVVVGVSDSVHLLVIFYQGLAAGEPRDEAITRALGHAGLAVVMTSVTTAAGLASFTMAELAPVAQLGVIAPIGVMLAMVYSLVLLPALLSLTPLEAGRDPRRDPRRHLASRVLTRLGDAVTARPVPVLLAAGAVLMAALPGLMHVRFSHDGLAWFPEEDPMRQAAELIDRELGGAGTLEVLIHTDRKDGLHEPETLRRIEAAMRISEQAHVGERPVGKAISIVDVVKEIHQALNENRADHYVLPDDRALIAQELLLFENSGTDDLEEFADTDLSIARLRLRTPWADSMLYVPFAHRLRADLADTLGGDLRFELTGGMAIYTRIFHNLVHSMARSYAFALLVITPLLVLLVGDLRRGLAAIVPNLIPIYLTLALMGWMGIPLDVSTLLIGGILLGLAVDDTIHFMHKFNRYLEDTGDARRAVRETLATTGSALFFTSLILSLGFAVFWAAYLNNTFWFGVLASISAAVAFLADVIVAPALMVLLSGRSRSRAKPGAVCMDRMDQRIASG